MAKNLNELMDECQKIADKEFDGHITILKFTTGWKIVFGTPYLYDKTDSLVDKYTKYDSLQEGLTDLIERQPRPTFWEET